MGSQTVAIVQIGENRGIDESFGSFNSQACKQNGRQLKCACEELSSVTVLHTQ